MNGTYTKPLIRGEYEVDPFLEQATTLAHGTSFDLTGDYATCIETSHALKAYVEESGYKAELVRVTATTDETYFTDEGATRHRGTTAGRRYHLDVANSDVWAGHLAVLCDGYLLDATATQLTYEADAEHPVPNVVPPMAFPVSEGWDEGVYTYLRINDGLGIEYGRFHIQRGWKSSPASRPGHWMPILHTMRSRQRLANGEIPAGCTLANVVDLDEYRSRRDKLQAVSN